MTNSPRRKSRIKTDMVWEQIDRESNGFYGFHLRELAKRYPDFSPAELKVGALLKGGMLKKRVIGDKLKIEEKSVERCRVRIRRKLGLKKENLLTFLIKS